MNRTMVRNGFALALALLLAGCAGLRIPLVPEGETEERQAIQLISYAQRVAAMTPEEQREEYSASSRAFAKDSDALNRIRLALLLATPGASVHDAARAASLLEPMATPGDATSPLRALARLVYVQLNERAGEHKRAEQMREELETRKAIERNMREQIEGRKDMERNMREQIEARKEVERALREKLEELKAIERTIIQRGHERPPRRK